LWLRSGVAIGQRQIAGERRVLCEHVVGLAAVTARTEREADRQKE
jgi:hypothetical protein